MTSQRFSYLLILIMLVTPVTSVFGYYSGMAGQLFTQHTTVVADSGLSSDHCQQYTKSKQSCDTNSLCSFSVCGYGDIVAAFLILTLVYSVYRYRQKNKTFPRSFAVAPEIKPPIYSF